MIGYLKNILIAVSWMGNKYTKSFTDVFKMYLEIFPRQAVYEVEIQMYFKYI